jgi:hypothetical protein
VQAAGLLPALLLLERAAEGVALLPPHPIVLADYGSSEGRNSLLPMAAAIAALRQRIGPEQAICVVHTDLPSNDFAALFQTLADDRDSYLRGDPAVFPSAIGRSYFEQVLPANSVTLGWSSWAIQWLSRVPATIPDHVQVAYSRDPGARDAFARQAREDWRTFLIHRSKEMRPGGRLVVLTMATDDEGSFGYTQLLEAIYATLVAMVGEGFLRAEELRRMAIPTVARTRADFTEPFAGGYFSDLTVEHLEIFYRDDRIWVQFEANGDAHAFGAQWAAFSRASVFPTLAAALDDGRDDKRSTEFIGRLESGVTERLAAAPARTLIPLAQMSLVKRGDGAGAGSALPA